MTRITAGMRRVLWEVALTGGRLPADDAERRMVRYSLHTVRGGVPREIALLVELGMVEGYQEGGVTLLRLTEGVSVTEREKLVAAAVKAASNCRSEKLTEGRAALHRLGEQVAEMARSFAGPLAPEVDYALGDSAVDEIKRMARAQHDLAFMDRAVNLEQVAPEYRAMLEHLYARPAQHHADTL